MIKDLIMNLRIMKLIKIERKLEKTEKDIKEKNENIIPRGRRGPKNISMVTQTSNFLTQHPFYRGFVKEESDH